MLISVVSANALDSSDGTPEDWAGEVFNLVSEAAVVASTIESEGKQTRSFYLSGVINGPLI